MPPPPEGQPCHLSLPHHHSPPPIKLQSGCWTPLGAVSAHHPLCGATWSQAHCPLAGRGPSRRRCGLHRAPSTKESANASAGPRATASLPQLMAAPTSSCTSLTWKGSMSQWKAT
ncbi:CARHSP1 isoform 18, partial [Pan troglodytes]